jgi:hypothetical protein
VLDNIRGLSRVLGGEGFAYAKRVQLDAVRRNVARRAAKAKAEAELAAAAKAEAK